MKLAALLEALLLSADSPLEPDRLQAAALAQGFSEKQFRQALAALEKGGEERGVELVRVAGGLRFQTKAEYQPAIHAIAETKAPNFSRALLETLALIAYRQPITRGDIETLRGVSVSSQMIRTLSERGWIKVVGRKETPGRPALLGTTSRFLEDFALKSLEELPDLPPA